MTVTHIDPRPSRALVFTPLEQQRHHLVEAAVLAEQLGYDIVLVPEGWGLDASVVVTEIALRTSRIRIATGITSIWGRSPATLAMMAATLDDLSGGRFTLGLGASTPLLAERFHDVKFHRPAGRLGHAVREVRALLEGRRVTPTVTNAPGLRLGVPARPGVPIWAAAHGPRATRIATTYADGWFPALVPRDHLATLRATAQTSPSDEPHSPLLIAGPMVSAGSGSRHSAEQLIGWYFTGMGRFYGDFVASCGFGSAVAAIRSANPHPTPGSIEWPSTADSLLDQLAAFGEPAAIANTLAEWDQRADIVAVCVGPDTLERVLTAVDAGAPPARLATAS
jgi:alkanesulfonate monooxygenase SsuD/methylene tetrahydromethanopterin reductase-like flavin-dependent oxidoreductase (luciferase family)